MKFSGPEIKRGNSWRLRLEPNDNTHRQKLESQIAAAKNQSVKDEPQAFFDAQLAQVLASQHD